MKTRLCCCYWFYKIHLLLRMHTENHFKFPENPILSFCITFHAYHACMTWHSSATLRTNFARKFHAIIERWLHVSSSIINQRVRRWIEVVIVNSSHFFFAFLPMIILLLQTARGAVEVAPALAFVFHLTHSNSNYTAHLESRISL